MRDRTGHGRALATLALRVRRFPLATVAVSFIVITAVIVIFVVVVFITAAAIVVG